MRMARARRKDTFLYVVIAVLLIALLTVVPSLFMWNGGLREIMMDTEAKQGPADYKSLEDLQAELNEIASQGMLTISISTNLEFENGTSEAVANIENPDYNSFITKVVITLAENGEIVYESGGIEPGQFIEKIRLDKDLEAGTYPAIAEFQAYDPESLNMRGSTSAQITITVEH